MANKLADSIQMEVRNPKACRMEFDFTVPADVVKSETQKTLRDFAGAVSIPGFRAGKAPASMIRAKYENEVKEELNRRIMYAAYELASKDNADLLTCDISGNPELKFDEEFKFTFAADIAPEFEAGDYKAIKVEVPLDAVTDEQVDERISFFRKMYGNYIDATDSAKAEDMLKVDYKSDFAVPEDANASVKRQLNAENAFVWLSEPETIPGCIAALTGAEVGKEYTFDAAYAEDYREEALKGKTVKYTVKVQGIQRRAELSDAELAEKANVKDIDAFKDVLRKSMEMENEGKQRQAAVTAVYDKLNAAIAEFELPPTVLQAEIQRELSNLAQNVRSEEDAEKFKAEIETHKAEAEKSAKESLRKTFILRKIAKAEDIRLEEAEVNAQLQEISRQYGYPAKEFRAMLEKNGRMDQFQLELLNAKVLDKLAEAASK